VALLAVGVLDASVAGIGVATTFSPDTQASAARDD
jgi:hypothetical protein